MELPCELCGDIVRGVGRKPMAAHMRTVHGLADEDMEL